MKKRGNKVSEASTRPVSRTTTSSRVARWFFSNWEIHLLALIMAIILRLYTSYQARTDLDLEVEIRPEDLIGKPLDVLVTSGPLTFSVTVNAPRSIASDMSDRIRPQISFSSDKVDGSVLRYVVDENILQLHPSVQLVESRQDNIEFALDRVVEGDIDVVFGVGDVLVPEEGLDIQVSQDVHRVQIRGPERFVSKLKELGSLPVGKLSLPSLPADMDAAKEFKALPLKLIVPPELADHIEVVQVPTATVTVLPKPAEKDLSLPVAFLSAPGFFEQYVIESDSIVPVKVTGPKNNIDKVTEDEFSAYIRLPLVPDLDRPTNFLVHVDGPAWAQAGKRRFLTAVIRKRKASKATEPALPDDNEGQTPVPEPGDTGDNNPGPGPDPVMPEAQPQPEPSP